MVKMVIIVVMVVAERGDCQTADYCNACLADEVGKREASTTTKKVLKKENG